MIVEEQKTGLLQVGCRLKTNLPQIHAVLDGSVAGVATVAGFFISIRKKEKERERAGENPPNKFKSAATPATVATARTWTARICGSTPAQVATNLQQVAR